MKYENRIIAYIDILGFKNIIANTVDEKGNDVIDKINSINEIHILIRDVWDLDKPKLNTPAKCLPKNSKNITIFSDTIVVSFKIDEQSGVFFTLLEIKWMLMRLINKGILCRGAVSYGKLVHNSETIFGPALVEAYSLESKAALYPRIILDEEIIKLGARFGDHKIADETEYIKELLMKDADGMYYIDYFEKVQSELDDPTYDFPLYIEKLKKIIEDGLKSSKNSVDVRIKYSWMKEKFNILVDKATSEDCINYYEELGLADYYTSLKKIQ
jgi:hypothetical protein